MSPTIYGHHPEAVVALMKTRRDGGYVPGVADDGCRLGLVIEGGAMRGAVSSGAVDALHQLGFSQCFDAVYGTSSGALNAAYFVSGQITLGTTIYYENAIDPQFINLWRWPDPLDVRWLIDTWIAAGKPLDLDAVMRSPTALAVTATDAETGEVRYFGNRTDPASSIIPALRASCSTPMFVTHLEPIEGRLYNDGMLQAGIPVQKAVADGCTHLVGVLTRRAGYRKTSKRWIRWLENLRLRRYSEAYRRSYHMRHDVYNEAVDILYGAKPRAETLVLAPGPDDPLIGNAENRPDPLKRAVRESMDRVAAALGEDKRRVRMYRDIEAC